MALLSRGLALPTVTCAADALPSSSRQLGCNSQRCRTSLRMSAGLFKLSVGRQSNHGTIQRIFCHGWQLEKESFRDDKKRQSRLVCGALPTEVTAAATAVVVGGALFALTRLNKESVPVLKANKECEVCGGSGLCVECKGEGFVNKNLSAEAAAKARARAKDAATRYTAGLAKKWNYCTTCAGQRGCQACEGRGWVK